MKTSEPSTAHALTERARRFCEAVATGETQANAYKLAGYRARGDTAKAEASKLMRKPAVKAYLAQLRIPQKASAVMTRQRKREILCDIMEGRIPGTTVADRIRAIQADNLMTGDNKPVKIEGEITLRRILDAIDAAPSVGEED